MLARRMSLDGFEYDIHSNSSSSSSSSSLTNDIVLNRHMDWRIYTSNNDGISNASSAALFLDQNDIQLLHDYDESPLDNQRALLRESGQKYAVMFVKAIQNITSEDTVQYLLTLIEVMLYDNVNNVQWFHSLVTPEVNPYSSFLRVLARSNYHTFTIEKACHICTILLTSVQEMSDHRSVHQFCSWIIAKLTDDTDACRNTALNALKKMLAYQDMHLVFARDGGVRALTRLLRTEALRSTQIVYEAGFCLWVLSFNSAMYTEFLKARVVENLIDIIRKITREKVVRIGFAVLRNLCGKSSFNEVMIHQKFLDTLHKLQEKKFADKDIIDDMKAVDASLIKDVHEFSSFDVLQQELSSGTLSWTPVHTDMFWKENAHKCQDNDFEVIKKLIALLDSRDNDTVAIACFDLGEFATTYSGGKQVVQHLGGKERLMKHMSHESKMVQQHALLCVQKLMLTNWNHVQRTD